jgi:hypothetical protein
METFFLYVGMFAQMVMLGAIALGFVFAVYKK